jgi:transcriptional regulator with XRE-family HTH domain
MDNKLIGQRVRQFREQFKISRNDLINEFGISHSTMSRIENGKNGPDNVFLYAMMARYRANPNWILTGEGEMLLSPNEYVIKWIKSLGTKTISEGFLSVLEDSRFEEFQSLFTAYKFNQEFGNKELREFLRQAAEVWHQGDERIREGLRLLMKGYLGDGGKN